MRFKFLQHLMAIVDKCESCTLASTVLGAEAEAGDLVFVGFVEFRELGAEFVFRDVGAVGVEDVTGEGGNVSRNLLGGLRETRVLWMRDGRVRTRPFVFDLGGHCG